MCNILPRNNNFIHMKAKNTKMIIAKIYDNKCQCLCSTHTCLFENILVSTSDSESELSDDSLLEPEYAPKPGKIPITCAICPFDSTVSTEDPTPSKNTMTKIKPQFSGMCMYWRHVSRIECTPDVLTQPAPREPVS